MTVLAKRARRVISNGTAASPSRGYRAMKVSEVLVSQRIPLEELDVAHGSTLEQAYFQVTRDPGEHSTVSLAEH